MRRVPLIGLSRMAGSLPKIDVNNAANAAAARGDRKL